jgi:hypothetical protein
LKTTKQLQRDLEEVRDRVEGDGVLARAVRGIVDWSLDFSAKTQQQLLDEAAQQREASKGSAATMDPALQPDNYVDLDILLQGSHWSLAVIVTLATLGLSALLGIDTLRLWHDPAAGWGAAWPAWTGCFLVAAASTSIVQSVRAGSPPRLALTGEQLVAALLLRTAEGILYRGALLGALTAVLAGQQLGPGAPPSALTTLFLTPTLALAVGTVEAWLTWVNDGASPYGDSKAIFSDAGQVVADGKIISNSVSPVVADRFSRMIGAGTTLPWPAIGLDRAAATAERPVWPVIAAAAAGTFLTAETMALGSLQASVATAVVGALASTALAPPSSLTGVYIRWDSMRGLIDKVAQDQWDSDGDGGR